MLQEELQHNVFLRCLEPAVAEKMGTEPGPPTLAELRRQKDNQGLIASAVTMAIYAIQLIPAASAYFGFDH